MTPAQLSFDMKLAFNKKFKLFAFRSGRGKEERSRWDPNEHERDGRVRHNSGTYSQPPTASHLPNTPQRMPPNYDGRDRAMYSNSGDTERWRERLDLFCIQLLTKS